MEGYKVLDFATNKLHVTHNAVFHEDIFPLKIVSANTSSFADFIAPHSSSFSDADHTRSNYVTLLQAEDQIFHLGNSKSTDSSSASPLVEISSVSPSEDSPSFTDHTIAVESLDTNVVADTT